jgi:glycosyltransferase involved in cell wall biosynthesis
MNKSKNNKPLVSVVLPVYKSEEFLEACLRSLTEQTYKNIEIVAVVDYLGDNSLKILRRYKKQDKRLRVYSNLQRYGLASTLNRAVSLSRGQYIAFMDSQGVALKTRISKQLAYLTKNPKVAAVGSQVEALDENHKTVKTTNFPTFHEEIYKGLISGVSMKFESVMVDKTRLPKDILKFKKGTLYPFVYIDVFMKIGIYAELANIQQRLVRTRDIIKQTQRVLSFKKQLHMAKILFDASTNYDYKPSFKALFTPILRNT